MWCTSSFHGLVRSLSGKLRGVYGHLVPGFFDNSSSHNCFRNNSRACFDDGHNKKRDNHNAIKNNDHLDAVHNFDNHNVNHHTYDIASSHDRTYDTPAIDFYRRELGRRNLHHGILGLLQTIMFVARKG
jgi:hypothetical protein